MKQEKQIPTSAKRRLTNAVKKAKAKLKELDNIEVLEQDALKGLEEVAMLVGTEPIEKVSPLGHRVKDGNGKLDMALLKGEDVLGMLRAMMNGSQTRTKRELKDNRALVLRAQEHIRYLSGRSQSSRKVFRSRLKKIGLEEQADAIMKAMKPVAAFFDAHVKAGTY